MKKMRWIVCIAVVLAGGSAWAEKPFQVSLTPEVALVDRSEEIKGVVIGAWSENPQKAFALGLVSGSTGDSAGFSWSLFVNYADNYKGVQWALVNYTKGNFTGWQDGFVNYVRGDMKGFQSGVVNYAGCLTGLQLGFVNYSERAKNGAQIGLVNILRENPWFSDLPNGLAPGMVFVNWRF